MRITDGYIKEMEENPHPRPTTPVVKGVVPRPLIGPVHPTHHLLYVGTKGGMEAGDMAPLFSNLYIGIVDCGGGNTCSG